MRFEKAGIIGLGLIGGSLAKALRNRCGVQRIVALNRNEDVLKQAFQEGIIDGYTTAVSDIFLDCDIIFLCTPVDKIVEYGEKLLPYLSEHTILTDVGSTKGQIYEKMSALPKEVTYIGGHPMTGSERFRYSAAKEHLFENAYYVITPGKNVPDHTTEAFSQLVSNLGAIPVTVSPPEHDKIVAAISHLPHVLAAALVNTVKERDSKDGYMRLLAAGGFKDITRIASSSPQMWQSICTENKGELLDALSSLEDSIQEIKTALVAEEKDKIYNFFDTAREYRDSFGTITPKSVVRRYEITVDVLDRPGSIAIIAVLFSSYNINIKNMSIINNREQEQGVLFFAFDSEEDRQKSITLLRDMNYDVFIKD